jgi:hypothetical protein
MMTLLKKILLCGILAAAATVFAVDAQIGYLYPAGGQQGTTVKVVAGGQQLRGAKKVYMTGEGVTVKSVRHMRGIRNLSGDQRRELNRIFTELRQKGISELPPSVQKKMFPKGPPSKKKKPAPEKMDAKTEETPPVKLPKHPLLEDLEDKSLRELAHVTNQIFIPRSKLQLNRQISELVVIELEIAPDAAPGFRELRVQSNVGLTNPLIFQVGTLPETCELEPNDAKAYDKIRTLPNLPDPDPLTLPIILNGQILPGDVDRFRFRAKKGQKLVIQTHARSLIPYLADAVPGWFQATVTLYTASGNEVAFADDFRFDPDPVMYYEITRDGHYELEIRDSIYRGREDFVYRLAVGETPFITQMFPLGGPENSNRTAAIDGWNLPKKLLSLDTAAGGRAIRKTALTTDTQVTNFVPYAVDTWPDCTENQANDSIKTAQSLTLPMIVNGRIEKSGDIDIFKINAKAGDEISAEVFARRLNSPLDSLLRVTDASGQVIEWNDDYVEKDVHLHKDVVGLTTHHADSYLTTKFPKTGTYYVHLADSQNHGGSAFGYRLHIGPKQPEFDVRITPSSITMPGGAIVPLTVHVLRKNDYSDEIEIVMKNTPAGFKLHGSTIPAGCNRITMTLQGPAKPLPEPVELKFEAQAFVDGKIIKRDVVAAENRMQAFLYRHLVPSEQMLVSMTKKRWRIPPVQLQLPGSGVVKIPAGGTAEVKVKAPPRTFYKQLQLQAKDGPEGLSIGDLKIVKDGFIFTVKAEKDLLAPGYADNLIVESFRQYTPKPNEKQPQPKERRDSMGIIRAIPIMIVDAKPTATAVLKNH